MSKQTREETDPRGRIGPDALKPPSLPTEAPRKPRPDQAPAILPVDDPDEAPAHEETGEIQFLETGTPRPPAPTRTSTLHPRRHAVAGPAHRPGHAPPGDRDGRWTRPRADGPPGSRSVFAFQRRKTIARGTTASIRVPRVDSAPPVPTPAASPGAIETEMPAWLTAVARRHAPGDEATIQRLPERSGFHVVHRVTAPDRWHDVAVVTFQAIPETPLGGDALRALRNLEVRTWRSILAAIAATPPPPLPLDGMGAVPTGDRILEPLFSSPAPGRDWASPLDGSTLGLVRPHLPWPTLADAGVLDLTLLETPIRHLLDRLASLRSLSSAQPHGEDDWADHVVDADTILHELARWQSGRGGDGPNTVTGRHFLIYTPMAAMTEVTVSSRTVVLPTQWRLLHKTWRKAFRVQPPPMSRRAATEDDG